MKVRTNRLNKPNRTTSERHRRSLLAAAAIALGGSLLLLLGAGWLQHGVSKMAISGLGALLLIGALTGIFRTLDFSTPRLVHGSPRQLAWIRIVVCLTAVIYTVIEDLPAIASLPVAMQSNYGSAISSTEVQQWRWNYAVDPNDPRLGWVIAVYPFDATAKASPPR
jgi:hypothetical protein